MKIFSCSAKSLRDIFPRNVYIRGARMRAILLAFLVLICACASHAESCAPVPARPRDNDKRYEAKKLAGDKAFRQGRYHRAFNEYREALAYQDELGAYDVFFKIGETHAMLGSFDKAYTCIIDSGSGKVPPNRVLAE